MNLVYDDFKCKRENSKLVAIGFEYKRRAR